MKLDILNIKGEKTNKEADLSDDIFSVEPNDHAIWLDVKRILAAARQGTHKAKDRGEVKGSTKKLRRQKGTGSARIGSIKSPLLRKGGRIFGPIPRDYSIKINKKTSTLARKSALTYKIKENNVIVLEDFTLETIKTKEFLQILKSLNLDNKKNLLVTADQDKQLGLASRNLPNAYICEARNLNTYSILNNEVLILTEKAVDVINKTMN